MHAPNENPGYELYLVIEGLKGQLASLLPRLRLLSQAPETRLLMGVDAFYRADKDLALLRMRFNSGLSTSQRRRLIGLACRGGVPVLDPLRLNDNDKTLFYQRHLCRYAVRIDDKKSPNCAIDALGQLLGLIQLRADSASDASETPGVTRVRGSGRSSRDIDLVLAPHRNGAIGTESDSYDVQFDDKTVATEQLVESRSTEIDAGALDFGPAGRSSLDKPNLPARLTTPAGKGRRSERMPTIPARPVNTQHRAASPRMAQPLSYPRRPRATSAPLVAAHGNALSVRFERGDTWMPARLRNLTLRQVRLAASAAPPLGSQLRVFVSLGTVEATLPGVVVEVINTESSVDGSTSFRVELLDVPQHDVEQLTRILRQARRDNLELSPPPARKSRRFAVTWPIAIVSSGQRFSAAALDVSQQGLFIATTNLIRARKVVFGIPLDTKEATVQGRARIAREVTEDMATSHNLNRGYGLHFEALHDEDQERYAKFLERIGLRSQLHVLVAGDSATSFALAECFQSAGYAVTQASSVESMEERRSLHKDCPDVAVLDERDLDRTLRTQFEKSFEAHSVPMMHVRGQGPTSARIALDRLMTV